MYIKQADLFRGVKMDFLKKVMDVTLRESYPAGAVLFEDGDPAAYLFILINGRIELSMGEAEKQIHIGSQTGESFGWAGLVGRETFRASGRCLEKVDLLRIDVNRFKQLLDEYREDGFIFYQNLSEALGKRLMQSYQKNLAADDCQ
jgi:CRP-like cAMP-binding protein